MPADTPEMKAAREALIEFVAYTWDPDRTTVRAVAARSATHLRAALARVDELQHLEASQHKARARDVAAIVGWLRTFPTVERSPGNLGCMTIVELADAIERGDWHDGTFPPDPRDARIAELEAELAWHEDRHDTRAAQEADDAEAEEEWAAVAALSDEEVAALNAKEGIDTPAARKRFDTFLRVLTREANLKAKLNDAEAQLAAARRLLANDYTPWESAGGPNDCAHQRSTPCPECDRAVVGVRRG